MTLMVPIVLHLWTLLFVENLQPSHLLHDSSRRKACPRAPFVPLDAVLRSWITLQLHHHELLRLLLLQLLLLLWRLLSLLQVHRR